MSVILKSETEYSEILKTIMGKAKGNDDFRCFLKHLFREDVETLNGYHSESKALNNVLYWFVDGLHRANEISYTIRYHEPTTLSPFNILPIPRELTIYELIQSLRSAQYQIEQPHKYDDHLSKLISHLALSIVTESEDYQKAEKW